MKGTKSLRLREDEIQDLKLVEEALRLRSESATLQRIFEDGLRQVKADAVVHLYVNEGRTIGETAQQLAIPVPQVVETLTQRHVKIMDVPAESAARNMQRVAALLDLPNMQQALKNR